MLQVDNDEIRQSFFSMNPLKVSGVDGYPTILYQSQWYLVGDSICRLVKEVFSSRWLPDNINRTLLVLVPKVGNPISLKLYRPISLCIVPYKIVTKLIANRLKCHFTWSHRPTANKLCPRTTYYWKHSGGSRGYSYNEEKDWKCGVYAN